MLSEPRVLIEFVKRTMNSRIYSENVEVWVERNKYMRKGEYEFKRPYQVCSYGEFLCISEGDKRHKKGKVTRFPIEEISKLIIIKGIDSENADREIDCLPLISTEILIKGSPKLIKKDIHTVVTDDTFYITSLYVKTDDNHFYLMQYEMWPKCHIAYTKVYSKKEEAKK